MGCISCGNCCREFRVQPDAHEYERIEAAAAKLGIENPIVYSEYPELRRTQDDECVFLKDNLCGIYPDRPDVCAQWPFIAVITETGQVRTGWDSACMNRGGRGEAPQPNELTMAVQRNLVPELQREEELILIVLQEHPFKLLTALGGEAIVHAPEWFRGQAVDHLPPLVAAALKRMQQSKSVPKLTPQMKEHLTNVVREVIWLRRYEGFSPRMAATILLLGGYLAASECDSFNAFAFRLSAWVRLMRTNVFKQAWHGSFS